MKYFQKFSLPEKISLSFSLFGFFSLVLFLLLVNITYFFIWYSDQKQESFSDMNVTYDNYMSYSQDKVSQENFREYLLSQDTMIIPESGEVICSPGVSKKIHNDIEAVQDEYFYKDGDTIYFIYSKYFEGIGQVKVFFDTTEYIRSQISIIKVGIIFIFLIFLVQYGVGKYITRILLRPLRSLSKEIRSIDIHAPKTMLVSHQPKHDEVHVLTESFNTALTTITDQTGRLKQFLTDVSHEFKTPLMVMSSKLDLLEKKAEKETLQQKDIAEYFAGSRREIQKMNSLLESLFLLSQVEENKLCLVTNPTNIREIFTSELDVMKEKFPHKNIQADIKIPHDLVYDIEQSTFRICVQNLLSNACKFSGESVKLVLEADENHFSIADNGPGIPERDREKIWDKFYRTDTKKEGFGVGLYLVKRVSDMYNWTITLKEQQPQGIAFIFSIHK